MSLEVQCYSIIFCDLPQNVGDTENTDLFILPRRLVQALGGGIFLPPVIFKDFEVFKILWLILISVALGFQS